MPQAWPSERTDHQGATDNRIGPCRADLDHLVVGPQAERDRAAGFDPHFVPELLWDDDLTLSPDLARHAKPPAVWPRGGGNTYARQSNQRVGGARP